MSRPGGPAGTAPSKSGYTSLNLQFKKASASARPAGPAKAAGGLQVLGKLPGAAKARVHKPVALPSLRSENSGLDPSVT